MCSSCILYLYWVRSNQIILIYSPSTTINIYIHLFFSRYLTKSLHFFQWTYAPRFQTGFRSRFRQDLRLWKEWSPKAPWWPPIPAIHSGSRLFEFTPNEEIWMFPKIVGFPQIINFDRVFHYKPSILGYPYFWKHPYFLKISPKFFFLLLFFGLLCKKWGKMNEKNEENLQILDGFF